MLSGFVVALRVYVDRFVVNLRVCVRFFGWLVCLRCKALWLNGVFTLSGLQPCAVKADAVQTGHNPDV